MIDCAAYRRAWLADPNAASPELAAHLASCAACAAWSERARRFEARLAQALARVPPVAPESGAAGEPGAADPRPGAPAERGRVIPLLRRRSLRVRGGWLAAAASVLIVLGMLTSLWLAVPHASLAADVVAHMAGEPEAWARTDRPVTPAELEKALQDAHLRLAPDAPLVSYAHSCWFRGHFVPHLVVQTPHGPVTVMVLVHEPVTRPAPFEEGGYRGVLMPDDGHGSLAVLARDPGADSAAVRATAEQVRAALRWQG